MTATGEVIAVSGASGALGRLVAQRLLAEHPTVEVILVTRDPSALDDLVRRAPRARARVSVRHGDFDAPAGLPVAFAGATRMLLISASSATGDRIAQHGAAIAAARAAGIAHVVFTSMPRVDERHPLAEPAAEYLGSERLLAGSGLAWTILRNGPYAELNLVERIADGVVDGALVTNAGDGRMALVSRADCAAAAVAVLIGDGHAGRTYDVTGPAALSHREIAEQLAAVLHHPVALTAVDDATMAARLRAAGAVEALVELRVAMGRAIRDGFFADVAPTVARLTGRAPQPVGAVLAAHRPALAAIFAPSTPTKEQRCTRSSG